MATDDLYLQRIWRQLDDDLIGRLTLYAAGRCSKIVWRGIRDGPTPEAREPQDFVSIAIRKTVGGQRRWIPAKASLYQHLAGAIRSEVSNLANSSENKMTVRGPISNEGDDNIEKFGCTVVSMDAYFGTITTNNPEDQALYDNEKQVLFDYIAKQDENLYKLAVAMLDKDLSGSMELSNELQISVREVKNRKKRLRRLVRNFFDADVARDSS
jgi:hypothetical protein